ncbi:quinone-dependent dihydroorotate dehydrogenase [Altibacter sp. HG106]|uniref:quinone-dependent dihydroorotate dehydrogenase n=1 Tax=Altibacter sp. HG106 TaxID=3023937 RepID=UPI00234FB640|nr:quinone-dependent dihydroorotate dehydrogenase [Altibacter sp. HG106]MDC7996266.1 quinone-dependent dihydroorotate dehydrogenase [Altibacter sp. HG106]
MYKQLIRPILFCFNPEKVHHITFKALRGLHRLGLGSLFAARQTRHESLQRKAFGLTFPNPVGLAAGFDKDAKLYKELSGLGFGFIEIGTLTPRPQPGNPKKRLFRLKQDGAIINRMGFNNEGVDAAVARLKKNGKVAEVPLNKRVLIGGNIGKNKTTPNDQAVSDYEYCFTALFEYVDYFVVNVSSPNTPNLRELQDKEPLTQLLNTLQVLNKKHSEALKQTTKPILLKIAPDLSESQLRDIIDIVAETKINGLIATNTSIGRDGLTSENRNEVGGLSGKPLTKRATDVIRFLTKESDGTIPIIGVGGIHSAADAEEKLAAGACLVQLYTGFIYEGPKLIEAICNTQRTATT